MSFIDKHKKIIAAIAVYAVAFFVAAAVGHAMGWVDPLDMLYFFGILAAGLIIGYSLDR